MADAQFVEAHLTGCETCRHDAAALTHLRTLLRSPGQVEHAPHGGLRKLMRRIDAAEGLPQAPELPHADAWAEPSTPGTRPVKQAQLAKGRVARWLHEDGLKVTHSAEDDAAAWWSANTPRALRGLAAVARRWGRARVSLAPLFRLVAVKA